MGFSKKKIVLLCLLVFFLGTFWFFPFQNIRGLIFKTLFDQTGMILLAEEIQPLFLGWPGVRLKKVTLSIPVGAESLEIASSTLDLRLRLSASFAPSVSLFFDGLSQGGSFFVQVGTRGDKLFLNLTSRDLSLNDLNFSGLDPGFEGNIKSDISINYHDTIFSETKGSLLVKGQKFKTPPFMVNNPMLGPPFQIPELLMGPINLDLSINNGAVVINSFQFGGNESDLKATLTGSSQLGVSPMDTQINLTVKLVFSPRIFKNPEFKTFLDFLGAYQGANPGEYGLAWNAKIQEIMNLSKALPTPVK